MDATKSTLKTAVPPGASTPPPSAKKTPDVTFGGCLLTICKVAAGLVVLAVVGLLALHLFKGKAAPFEEKYAPADSYAMLHVDLKESPVEVKDLLKKASGVLPLQELGNIEGLSDKAESIDLFVAAKDTDTVVVVKGKVVGEDFGKVFGGDAKKLEMVDKGQGLYELDGRWLKVGGMDQERKALKQYPEGVALVFPAQPKPAEVADKDKPKEDQEKKETPEQMFLASLGGGCPHLISIARMIDRDAPIWGGVVVPREVFSKGNEMPLYVWASIRPKGKSRMVVGFQSELAARAVEQMARVELAKFEAGKLSFVRTGQEIVFETGDAPGVAEKMGLKPEEFRASQVLSKEKFGVCYVSQAIIKWSADRKGKSPNGLARLVDAELLSLEDLKSPVSNTVVDITGKIIPTDYIYFRLGPNAPKDLILVYQNPAIRADGSTVAVTADGTLKMLTAEELKPALEASEQWVKDNPVKKAE